MFGKKDAPLSQVNEMITTECVSMIDNGCTEEEDLDRLVKYLRIRKELEEPKFKIDYNVLMSGLFSVICILIIVIAEQSGMILSSKATNFVPKVRL